MAAPTITATSVITGGAIYLDINSDATTCELQRSADDGTTWTTLENYTAKGANTTVGYVSYFDVGDLLQSHLDLNTSYLYQVIDVNGTTQSAPITPSASLQITRDNFSYIFVRLVQGALDSIVLPKGLKKASVLQAMPLARTPKLPLVTINLDLAQQSEVPIGRNVPDSDTNQWNIPGNAIRRFSIWVLAQSVAERDFYHDALLGLIMTIMSTAFSDQNLGMSTHYSYQAAQGQTTGNEKNPGFYYSQVMLEMDGPMNIGVTTDYGTPTSIDWNLVVTPP